MPNYLAESGDLTGSNWRSRRTNTNRHESGIGFHDLYAWMECIPDGFITSRENREWPANLSMGSQQRESDLAVFC